MEQSAFDSGQKRVFLLFGLFFFCRGRVAKELLLFVCLFVCFFLLKFYPRSVPVFGNDVRSSIDSIGCD